MEKTGPHLERIFLAGSALAAAYFVAGRVSLLLALPPTYVLPVWPAAGIALAGVILGGVRVLPGVFVGSLLVEWSVDRPGVAQVAELLVAATIALGASLQAGVAMVLIRRVSGPGNPLDRAASVIPVIALGGPVACAVNATIATLTHWMAGITPVDALAETWGAWWVGDSVGVVFLAPILLAWCARPAALWRRRRASVAVPLGVALGLVVGLYVDTCVREAAVVSAAFEERARSLAMDLGHHLEVQVAVAGSVSGLFAASNEVLGEEFAIFVRATRPFAPGLHLIQWGPIVTGDEGLRVPLAFVEPHLGNEPNVGFDYASEGRRREAIQRARLLRAPVVSAPIPILGRPDRVGVHIVYPTRDRRGVEGVVVAVVDVRDFVERTLVRRQRTEMALRLVDGETGEELYEEEAPSSAERWIGDVPWAGRTWRAEVLSTGKPARTWFSWLVLTGGLLLAGLLVTVIVEIVTRAVQVEVLVSQRTAELQQANSELLRSNLDLQRFAYVASHDLREPLRVVTTYTELLSEELAPTLDDEARRRLSRVVENARRMQDLVESLLECARAGRPDPFQPTDLNALARTALDDLGGSVRESGAVVTLGPLPTVSCAPVEVLSVFLNLFGNALKFRRPSVTPEVDIQARRLEAAWEISVRDNGIGIPPEHRERVFEMFQRLHPRDRYPGTGMGLAVCRQVIERHGGRIWIEPIEGPGTLVRFTLPERR